MTDQTPNQSPIPNKPVMLKVIALCSNIVILVNILVGFFGVSAFIIPVFIGVHTVLRFYYLKIESQHQVVNPNQTQTTIAPPMVRHIASVITAIILSVVLYGVGFGVATLVK